ncbi:unnamed protein product [Fusarium graminearum]|uniref:Chromosome 2, complete genome n=1 Tax=Gibberella zeae (strain ATCC MYA-4620 / CBS 123657 / FGSC 9075 / NRRL 31084 / PH-1) TaxID=229533 RepID=I1S8X9_GIBZE|nr:hypothetical protein FGSG_13308 [Fusarium graminearum PH-1]ESU14574.1 hypothetical protein FGSG_13308 [Fusarium graminearum PH-1]CEF77145.1 unnamed protein product [Fusarium graminearum]CZS80436.1 unnamed protein product [Fusarium graminearum]|eukprot:XP_011319999.1 hypothetical protein FGSG_13308 [Fusarium graminearum PH-1]
MELATADHSVDRGSQHCPISLARVFSTGSASPVRGASEQVSYSCHWAVREEEITPQLLNEQTPRSEVVGPRNLIEFKGERRPRRRLKILLAAQSSRAQIPCIESSIWILAHPSMENTPRTGKEFDLSRYLRSQMNKL